MCTYTERIMNSENIFHIDENLETVSQLNIGANVKSLSLHSNRIKHLDGLQNALQLKSLDVSSNQLVCMTGLAHLFNLRSLNLSCNSISSVYVDGLTNLVELNLSYNKIVILDCFDQFKVPESTLQVLLLHGNNISNLETVVQNLKGILSLKHLVFKLDGDDAGNPVCREPGYRARMLNELPQLTSLDHIDRNGCSSMYDVPVFVFNSDAEYLLQSSETSQTEIPDTINVVEKPSNIEPSTTMLNQSSVLTPQCDELPTPRINQILQKRKTSKISELPSPIQSNTSDDTQVNDKEQREDSEVSNKENVSKIPSKIPQIQDKVKSPATKRPSKHPVRKRFTHVQHKPAVPQRTNEKQTFMHLIKELENEREQRWKAEQASGKLASAVREMNSAQVEAKSLQNLAAQTTERLKQMLLNQKETNQQLKDNNEELKEESEALNVKLEAAHATVEEQKNVIRVHQKSLSKLKGDLATVTKTQVKKLQVMQMKLNEITKESEAKHVTNKQLEQSIKELQTMMVAKDESMRQAMSNKISIDSAEFQHIVAQRVAQDEEKHQINMQHMDDKIKTLQQEYFQLENEFREALHIEADRYNEVNNKYEVAKLNADKYQQVYQASCENEEKSKRLISQMTTIIKQQKVKIEEMLKSKSEINIQYQSQFKSLEASLEAERQQVSQLKQANQDRSRLLSQNVALQSLIDGLREERKVWGEELAHQGSSLAQDRGRFEMKIESLNAEISSLRKNNERDLDLLRIKTKVVDDQTDTIVKMKEALVQKDNEVRAKLDENLRHLHELEQQVDDLTQDNVALKEQNDHLVNRKLQLKAEINEQTQELTTLKDEHRRLKSKWSDKGELLTKLEIQVKNINVAAREREMKLTQENQDALEAKRLLEDRIARMDSTFQEQLDTIRVSHEQQIHTIQQQHQLELDRCNKKVHSAEEEMREILRDAENQKKNMQMKLSHIKNDFHELFA
uniref:leucine-rich repeat and coiled-coil domain-containing protein 1 isoform X2 n=1 Tax=Ciona intestinalis TaxID=7719 RepID=UPI00089DBF44|nr:leucine-rich repeat and coiled-coil domain-containing protein 1 isoform X2 [Ciona intestinalis]|eukprot:XP_018669383.1 leucine-rich repeat and coiled-coil domain-containing protein 1 isoform X2 [Ciona intestinalis]